MPENHNLQDRPDNLSVANVDVSGPATHSHIDTLIEAIRPAVRNARANGNDDLAERSSREEVRWLE